MFKKVTISFFLLLTTILGFNQTTLNPGEIAIVSMNCDGTDDFSFVLLVPVTNGTVIKFAESGWLSGGGFRGGGSGSEGTVTWTAGSALACGTEIAITSNGTSANTGSTSVSGTWALSTSGDQILAYQGTSAAPTFIYALNNEGAGVWQANATNTNTSAIPTGLTNGTNAVAVNEADNVSYNCSTTTPPAAILVAVSNNSNWLSDNTTPYSVPINCGFTCVACTPDPQPTTNSSNLTFPDTTCSSIDLSWIAGNGSNRIVVASINPIAGNPADQNNYTANSIFGLGATIAAGEFVVYNGSGTSLTVTGLSASTTYYFAIFEYNGTISNCEENYLIASALTGNFTTPVCPPTVCPEITGILVDACGGAVEGINEFFTFQNGNNNLEIDSLTANFPSGGSFCNSGCGGQNWTTNATYVAQLNTTAGCPGLFVEADPIPANVEVVVFTGASPTYNFDFTGLCGTGPYYAVFANNASTIGRFANYNATCSNRTLAVDFGATCTDNATYDRCLLTGGATHDGDYVAYDAAGNPTYQNDGCTPTAILPITLLYFKGKRIENSSNLIEWSTTQEINNDYFLLEHSNNAIDFDNLQTINGAGNSNSQLFYEFIDENPSIGTNYYRLKQVDFNGDFSYSKTIAIKNDVSDIDVCYSNNILNVNTINQKGLIEIFDVTGRKILSRKILDSNIKINLSHFKNAIYIYRFTSNNEVKSDKFIIQ